MNKEERRIYHLAYYHKRRSEYIDYLGGKCIICGSIEKLEFDHVDPSQKEYEIQQVILKKKELALKELDKCQLLCNSCHKEKTIRERNIFTHGTIYAWMTKKCRCELCAPKWRKWNDERNAKRRKTNSPRGPYNQPARHGTYKRYKRGCKCHLCKAANSQHTMELRKK